MKKILDKIGDTLHLLIILAVVGWFIYGFLGAVHDGKVSHDERIRDDARHELMHELRTR